MFALDWLNTHKKYVSNNIITIGSLLAKNSFWNFASSLWFNSLVAFFKVEVEFWKDKEDTIKNDLYFSINSQDAFFQLKYLSIGTAWASICLAHRICGISRMAKISLN